MYIIESTFSTEKLKLFASMNRILNKRFISQNAHVANEIAEKYNSARLGRSDLANFFARAVTSSVPITKHD